MLKRFFLFLFVMLTCLSVLPAPAKAGFGISPPYVKTNTLLPGSKYEQIITLLRSSAEDELEADITIDAPEIEPWLQIENGTKFVLPKDQLQVPMKVIITPPDDAELGNYTGHISVKVAPKSEVKGGSVAIALGARIDLDITLTDEEAPDFKVRAAYVPGVEMLEAPWNWPILRWFFYRLKVKMTIENTGNVEVAPSKVTIDITDLTERSQLESSIDKSIKKIKPFETADVYATFPTNLGKGDYWAKVKIYKDNQVLNSYKIAFKVAEPGTFPEGRIDLGYWPYLIAGGLGLFLLLSALLTVKLRLWRYPARLIKLIFWPVSALLRLSDRGGSAIKKKFWLWIGNKAKQFDGDKDKKEK